MLATPPRRTLVPGRAALRSPALRIGLALAMLVGLTPALLALGTNPAWSVAGGQAGANYGYAVAGAGDVNGDGFGDVIVGAPFYDGGTLDGGRAFVYLGGAGGPGTAPAWFVDGGQAGASLGWAVAGAGDVNGDGFGDVIVGAPGFDNIELADAGLATLYLGGPAGLSTAPSFSALGTQAGASLGWAVAGAGDVNGDGFAEFVIGETGYDGGQADEGRATVYLGGAAGVTPQWVGESNVAGARFGWSVGGAGDVDGDGFADVVIGAPELSADQATEGRVYLYRGSAGGLTLIPAWTAEGNQAGAAFGRAAAGAGDVNGDGFADLVVGAPNYDSPEGNEGRAFVYLGGATGLSATPAWTAESDRANANFGTAAAGAGDVNGDGFADLVVGAPELSNDQANEGRAYAYLGGPAGPATTPFWTVEGDQDDAILGRSAAGAGDVDGDGAADVLVGAYLYDGGQPDEGQALLFLGAGPGPGPRVASITLADPSPTRAGSLRFAVTFSAPVSGVDASDFTLAAGGLAGASLAGVSGAGAAWTVTVDSGAGSGTLRLDVRDDDTIVDGGGAPLGGAGAGNGAFSSGPAYLVDRTPPVALELRAGQPAPGSAALSFSVTYSDNLEVALASLDGGDITVGGPGGFSQPAALVSVASGAGAARIATYSVGAPGGAWGPEDEGRYSFSLGTGAVADGVGNLAAAAVVGALFVGAGGPLYLPVVQSPPQPGLPDLVVAAISLGGDGVAVTIRNQGAAPVGEAFWVDLYINPATPPAAPNQTWPVLGPNGVAWAVAGAALPLDPGESLTLRIGDSYYYTPESNPTASVAAGSVLYAQVDSANVPSATGAILERDERPGGGPYNNISRLEVTSPGPLGGGAATASLMSAPARGLPER